MTINEVIAKLEAIRAQHGDIEVMFSESDSVIRSMTYCNSRVAEEGEFPDDWDMPEGFTFVEIGQ
jgi:hypothetical protein